MCFLLRYHQSFPAESLLLSWLKWKLKIKVFTHLSFIDSWNDSYQNKGQKSSFLTDDRFDRFDVFVTKLITKSLKKQKSEVWRMAHWFHRNPLKGTAEQSFEIKMVQMDVEAVKVCSDLKQSRKRLIRFVLSSLLRSHSLELFDSLLINGKILV